MKKEYKNYLVQRIDSNKAKHYKKKELEFDYIPVNEFKKLEKDSPLSVIGSIKLKVTNKAKIDTVSIHSNDRIYTYELINKQKNQEDKSKKEPDSDVLGYLLVGENTYVSIIKNNLLFIILLLLLIGISMTGLFLSKTDDNNKTPTENTQNSLEFEDGDDWNGEVPQENDTSSKKQESIKIPGYANLYVSSKNPNIKLINPDGNTVYMTYTIMEKDKIIYETKAIKPDQMIDVNLKDLLSIGEHELTFIIATYDTQTQASCNGATQSVNLLVKE